jgi:hypothetical protein
VTRSSASADLATVRLASDEIEVALTTSVGPRVIRLARPGGPNVFVELPDAVLECPGGGTFHLRGGHRLWVAPEVPPTTYLPDDEPVILKTGTDTISATSPAGETDVERTIGVSLGTAGAVVVDHLVENRGERSFSAAAWAITQLPPDGIAVLPQAIETADPWGVQPNRSVVLWPYTDLGAPGVEWTPALVLIRGVEDPRPFKIGVENQRGWLAHWRSGELFVKWSRTHRDGADYLDRGASAQVYRNNRFIELETLSPLTVLAPGERIEHREVWRLLQPSVENASDLIEVLASIEAEGPPPELEGR